MASLRIISSFSKARTNSRSIQTTLRGKWLSTTEKTVSQHQLLHNTPCISSLANTTKITFNVLLSSRVPIQTTVNFSHKHRRLFSSSSFPITEHSKKMKGKQTANYRVNKIYSDGSIKSCSLTVADIIRGSSVNARDLFSLALSTFDEDCNIVVNGDGSMTEINNDSQRRKRKIISRNPPPVILPRGENVVVSFGHIKALIGRDEGMLFTAHHPSVQLLTTELSDVFRQKSNVLSASSFITDEHNNDPFEIVFLEQILQEVCSIWSRRILLYQPIVDNLGQKTISSDLDYSQSNGGVQRLVPLKDSLQNFEMQVSQALHCLTTLLNDDEDMLQLLLTAQAAAAKEGKDLDVEKHESVELIFEEYSRQLNNLLQEINYLLRRVESKQDLLKMSLDTYRNQMLRVNVYLSVGAVCLATSTTVAGYFGMNLVHGYESSETAFAAVVAGTTCLCGTVFLWCMFYLNTSRINKAAVSQFEEIKIITKSLSDLNAVDYAAKFLAENEEDIEKEEFKSKLNDARIDGREISSKEVDFLFGILDSSKDGRLQKEEVFRLSPREDGEEQTEKSV